MGLKIGICAGGKSRRMGSDKALLKWGGTTLAELLFNRFSDDYPVIFSLGASYSTNAYISEHIPQAMRVYDEYEDYGPVEGIRRILEAADTGHVFICGVDMPFISVELVKYMEQFISGEHNCICLTTGGRPQPLCAIYSTGALSVIKELIHQGEHRLTALVESLNTRCIGLEYTIFNDGICANINDPVQYAAAKPPVVFGVCGYSNSGKTTLICELVKRFAQDGLKTAVIKHTSHGHSFEKKDSDTERFSEAGALYRCIFSGNGYSFSASEPKSPGAIAGMCGSADIIIIEGMKNDASFPRIITAVSITGERLENTENVICTVDDYRREAADISSLYRTVLEYFDLEKVI